MKILALSGSLRAASLNTALLNAARDLAPEGAAVTLHDYRDVPHYNGDLDEASIDAVGALKAAIGDADAVLIATPEFNYSVPGVLKNAIDWASRPGYQSVFRGKPVGVLGASPSIIGTARAQAHLKNVLLGMLAQVFPYPEFTIARAHERFSDGAITDEQTTQMLRDYLTAFADWVARVGEA